MTFRNRFRLLAEDKLYSSRWNWFWKPCLRAASFFYGAGLRLHRGCFQTGILKRRSFDLPVVSVGNLTWGGTGKTLMVEHLARFLIARGKTPLILARGYGSDEAGQLKNKLPQARFGFGKDRWRAGLEALSKGRADAVILDDGFQHGSIARNFEIVVVNALNPFGNMNLIPRGILREPVSALKRASLIALNDVNLVSRKDLEALKTKIKALAPKAELIETYHEPLYFYRPLTRQRIYLERLQGVRVTTFSGIGTPRSFQMLLINLGLKCVRSFEFSDHHMFSDRELEEIRLMKDSSGSEEVITTEKDYCRAEEAVAKIVNPLVLAVRLRVSWGEELLRSRIESLLGARFHPTSGETPFPENIHPAASGVSHVSLEERKSI